MDERNIMTGLNVLKKNKNEKTHDEKLLQMSVFDGLYNSEAKQSEIDWDIFVEFNLKEHQPWGDKKNYATLINFVEFNKSRSEDNAIRMHALIIDYDDGLTIDEAVELFKSYEFILYSSFNHQRHKYHPDGSVKDTPKDKFRIIMPFEVVCEKKDWLQINEYVLKFAPDCDNKCKAISQCYTANYTHPDYMDRSVRIYNEGEWLDWRKWDKNPVKEVYKGGEYTGSQLTDDDMFPPSQAFKLKGGGVILAEQVRSKVSGVYCPFHVDKSPGSFLGVSKHGRPFHHCSSCDKTRWMQVAKPDDANSLIAAIKNFRPRTEKPVGTTEEKELVGYEEKIIHEYSNKHVEEIPFIEGGVFIKSPKGTGKTYQLTKIVEHCKEENLSVVVVGHRVTLLAGMAERLGLTDYKTLNWEAVTDTELKYLAICINSIEKIGRKKYDVVILDESEQVLQHFTGSTIKPEKRKSISQRFYNLVHDTKTVMCLDADLTDLTIAFIRMTRDDKDEDEYIAHRNNYTVDGDVIRMWENKANMVDDIEESIRGGKSVFVATNSKNFVHDLSDRLTSDKIKHTWVTQENSDSEEVAKYLSWIGNTENVSKNEILLASPSLGTGVDIQARFDVVYGLFESKPTTHYDHDQQISRVRNADEINVWVAPQVYHDCTRWRTIKNNIEKNNQETRALINYDIKDVSEPWFDMVFNLYAMVEANRAKSMNKLRANFEAMKIEQGYTLEHIAKITKKRQSNDLKEMRALNRQQLKDDLIAVEKLSYDEYRETCLCRRKSETQKLAVHRYEIEDFFKDDVAYNPDTVDWYLDGKRESLRSYELFTLPEDVLMKLDRGGMALLPINRKNLTLKVKKLKEGLTVLGLLDNGELNTDQELVKGNENVNAFSEWAQADAYNIKQAINLKTDGSRMVNKPMDVIKGFLKAAGLIVVITDKEKTSARNYLSVYQLDSCHLNWLKEQAKVRDEWYENH